MKVVACTVRSSAKECELCHATVELQRCHGCLTARYCSPAHARADWPRHRRTCVPTRREVDTAVTLHVRAIQAEIDTLDPEVPYVDFTHRVMGATREYRGALLKTALEVLQELLYHEALNDYARGVIKIYGFIKNYFTRHFFALFQEKHQRGGFVLWCGGQGSHVAVLEPPHTRHAHAPKRTTTTTTTEKLLDLFFPTRA